jgi:hypothetical protein
MPITMRRTEPASPVDKDREDFTICSGNWEMGRIYKQKGNPEHLRWFWSIFGILAKPADVRTDGHAPTFEAAKKDLEASWCRWLAWAELSETPGGHTARQSPKCSELM